MSESGDAPVNAYGQPVGARVPDWRPPDAPDGRPLAGSHCRLERLEPGRHGEALGRLFTDDVEPRDWIYLPFGPFESAEDALRWADTWSRAGGFVYYVIVDPASGAPTGVAAYLRIEPGSGSIEIGGILFSRSLMRTAAATEAMFLLIDHAFALGYRRCEWKCDALNEPSMRAARRLGFCYEGTFRQAAIVRGRSRDTAWFALTDGDWSGLRDGFRRWLHPSNFGADGEQRARLSDLRPG